MMHRIGRYEVQSELGRGGFGQVFRAFDPTVGRMVAIKTLTAGGEPELLTRFRNEAAAAGKLRHKNIVIIYDFGEHDGSPYLVMELLDGEDLEHIIDRNAPLTLLQKLDIMVQVAAGLDHAHKNGVVHRDVKPANVMLLPDGSVKILDFGIALVTQTSAARITPKGSLLGTFPYMAPEQFYGSASDMLCDIFAYGVTSYKLLTGKHPFHALEMAKLMHNIMNMSPEPVRTCYPECPEALEDAMIKLLAKDRDSRYQSLEDLQFDLEPVIIDLRKESVRDLVVHARDLIEAGQLEDAQGRVRQALEIEPGNRTARELRENLQRLIREKTLRPQIDALVSEGRVRLDERSFEQAIEKFESALRLDKSNPNVHMLLEEARAAWTKAQRADRLVEEAGMALNRGDLTVARESLSEALAADPKHGKAAALLSDIQVKLDARERERRLRDDLSRVRGLMLLQSFEEAAEALHRILSQYPESTEASALLERVRKEQEALTRRKRLEALTIEAKELLRKRQYAEAVEQLSRSHSEFPESAELRDLAAYAEEQLSEQKQAQAVARIGLEAQALAEKGQFEAAIEKLRSALDQFPGAAALRELMQNIASAYAARQRQNALDEVVRQAAALCDEARFAEALERINTFLRVYGDSAALVTLRKQAEEGFERQGRTAAIRRLVTEAQGLINAGRPATATEVLLRATREFPGEAQVTTLLDLAQDKLRGQKRDEAISNLIREAEGASRAGQFDRALALIDEGLRDYPDAERLLRCRSATLASRSSYEKEMADQEREKRRQQIAGVMEQAKRQLALDRAQEALKLLEPLAVRYPDEEQLLELIAVVSARIREQQRAAIFARTIAEAEAHTRAGRHDDALRLLDAALTEHGAEQALVAARNAATAAKTAFDRERSLAETRCRVAVFHREGRFEEALREIQSAENRWGHDFALAEWKKRIVPEWQARQREAELEAARQRDRARLLAIEALVEPSAGKRKLQSYESEVNAIAAANAADREIPHVANRIRGRIQTAKAAARKPIPWIPIGVGALVAVVALAILVIVPKLFVRKTLPVIGLVPVEIRTDPAGASVHVGDRSCVTPNCRFDLPPGSYQASAELKDYLPSRATLTVDSTKPNGLLELNLQPVPVPLPPPAADGPKHPLPATLIIETGVPATLIVIDNRRRFRTDDHGTFRTELEAGNHEVRVEKTGYQTLSAQRVKIAEGASKTASFRLEPDNANLVLTGAPAGIELRAGDSVKRTNGSSPFSMPVKAGSEGLSVSANGLSNHVAQRFAPGQEVRLEWKNIAPPSPTPAPASRPAAENKKPAEAETPPKVVETPQPSVVNNPPPVMTVPPAPVPAPPTTQQPSVPDPKSQAKSAIARGIALCNAQQCKDAITIFGDAIRLDPNSAAAYYNRAGAHYNLGQYKDSISDYDRALSLDPNYLNVREHLRIAQRRLASGAYVPGDAVSAPAIKLRVDPQYTREARNARIEGTVVLELVVDQGGMPIDCRVVKSLDTGLDKNAVNAVMQWRFAPGLKMKRPVPVTVTLVIPFHLPH